FSSSRMIEPSSGGWQMGMVQTIRRSGHRDNAAWPECNLLPVPGRMIRSATAPSRRGRSRHPLPRRPRSRRRTPSTILHPDNAIRFRGWERGARRRPDPPPSEPQPNFHQMGHYILAGDGSLIVERRATPRYDIEMSVRVRLRGSDTAVDGMIIDLSESGARIVVRAALEDGETIEIRCPTFAG